MRENIAKQGASVYLSGGWRWSVDQVNGPRFDSKILSAVNGVHLHTTFHYHPHFDMTELQLKRT